VVTTASAVTLADAFDDEPIEVFDAIGGFARLERGSETLGGSLAVRAAQACTPLLEGNTAGHQIVLACRVDLRRSIAATKVVGFRDRDRFVERCARAVRMLAANRISDASFTRRFSDGPIAIGPGRRVDVFTGLVLRAPAGVRLRVSTSGNRRSRSFAVEERIVTAADGLVPLVVSLAIEKGTDGVVLEGDLATIVALPAKLEARREQLGDAIEVARAHVRFFDRAYFESKKKAPSRKYKRLAPAKTEAEAEVEKSRPVVRVVEAGGRQIDIGRDRLSIRAGASLSFTFDGNVATIDASSDRIAELARSITAAWSPLLEGPLAGEDVYRGALLYLTKYVTPHPRGEPHFFVKPPALVVTPPGWSTLVDGIKTPGFDVLRGAVRTDAFHAVPAVFSIAALGARHRVREGDLLAELFPAPRSLLSRPFVVRAFEDESANVG
jgi:hypothetical protein